MYSALILSLAVAGVAGIAILLRHMNGAQTDTNPDEDEWWRAIK